MQTKIKKYEQEWLMKMDNQLGILLRKYRESLNMSQEEFAKRIGKTKSTLSLLN